MTNNLKLDLEIDQCHVWSINLDRICMQSHGEILTQTERDYVRRFRFALDREHFIIRRTALRQILGGYMAVPPAEVTFVSGSHGKPRIVGQGGEWGLRFSCSHSGDLALIAVARGREIGVDIEQRRPLPEVMDLARSFFSPSERAALAGVPTAWQETAFFDCWTRKEAFVKALGLGLSFPLDQFTVSLAPSQPIALLEVRNDLDAINRWQMRPLDIPSDYSAALVAESGIAPGQVNPAYIRTRGLDKNKRPAVKLALLKHLG